MKRSMTRELLVQLIKEYRSGYPEEKNYKYDFLKLLNNRDCFLRSSLKAHFTGSVWATNSTLNKVLLLKHAKLKKWLQPGGHADGNEDLFRVAQNEFSEETGITKFYMIEDIFDIDIHQIPRYKHIPEHYHYDVRFHFIVDESLPLSANHEAKSVSWVTLEQVPKFTDYEFSFLRMIEKTKKMAAK